HRLAELPRSQLDPAVVALALERDPEVERGRERDAAGEIGELADQVDAARRPEASAHASCDSGASSAAAVSRRSHGWNLTVSRSIRCPSTESTVNVIPSFVTVSPGPAVRPRRPKTKPAIV